MRVRVLSVPGCGNVALLGARLALVLAGRADVCVEYEQVDDADQAYRTGMSGSPTLLVDGLDPFRVPGQPPSVACRLYWDADGRPHGAPSVPQLRAVLTPDGEER